MSAKDNFLQFSDAFAKRLKKQTGLTMGDYTALVLAGQNPSFKSGVAKFAKKLTARRAKGKKISETDVDQLLEMVTEYMEYQALSGAARVSFSRNLINKIIPSLTSTNLDNTNAGSVATVKVDDDMRDALQEWLENEI